MDNTVGAKAQRKSRRRKRFVVILLVIGVIAVLLKFAVFTDPSQSKGAIGVVRGTGAELETVFTGPDGLKVKWERILGQAWSVSLVEGRIHNVSDEAVRFGGIVYRLRDVEGSVVWEKTDDRYPAGGMIEPLRSIPFVCQPVAGRESKTFELFIKDMSP